jgi:hypothetical protein
MKQIMSMFRSVYFSAFLFCGLLLSSVGSSASNYELDHEITAKWQGYIEAGDQRQQQSFLTAEYLGDYMFETSSGNNAFYLAPKVRIDQKDAEKNLLDLQKAYWNHLGDGWELRAGFHKVFWGVTESRHLIDIINQTDSAGGIDGEDKLGQLMFNASIEFETGILDVFALGGHRQRTFPGKEGRLRSYFEVDSENARYESSKKEKRVDWAFRWIQSFDDTDIGLSGFHGTSREPLLLFNGSALTPKLIPYYPLISQLGIDIQHVYESWLFKFEGIHRLSFEAPNVVVAYDDSYFASVAGVEYTQVGLWDTSIDLGWLAEHLYDSRGRQDALAVFENDWFAGWRLAFNDMNDSELLAGILYDPISSERTFSAEYSQRLTDNWSFTAEARMWMGGDDAPVSLMQALIELQTGLQRSKLASLSDDDYLELGVTYYF